MDIEDKLSLFEATLLPHQKEDAIKNKFDELREQYLELNPDPNAEKDRIDKSWGWMKNHATVRRTGKHKKSDNT